MQHLFSDAPSPDELRGRQSQLQQTQGKLRRRRFELLLDRLWNRFGHAIVLFCWAVIVFGVIFVVMATLSSGRSR